MLTLVSTIFHFEVAIKQKKKILIISGRVADKITKWC